MDAKALSLRLILLASLNTTSAFAAPHRSFDFSLGSNSEKSREDVIRVRVSEEANQFQIAGFNLKITGRANASAHYEALVVKWSRPSKALPPLWTVRSRDADSAASPIAIFHAEKFDVSGLDLRVRLQRVSSQVSFLPSERNKTDVIAALPIDEYLAGVLPMEMPSNWPREALKAQAVAARSYAKAKMAERVAQRYDVESNVFDQVFRQPSSEDQHVAVIAAIIKETKGVELIDSNRKVVSAFFHADCGGKTEDARSVWGGRGSGTAIDGACPLSPRAVWSVSLTSHLLSERLRRLLKKSGSTVLSDIEALEKNRSGRISKLKLAWNDGQESTLSGHQFRMAIGHDVLKSAHFRIERDLSGFVFKGQGHGHGVGMCQWGARQLAQEGKSYREILAHYFPQARLTGDL